MAVWLKDSAVTSALEIKASELAAKALRKAATRFSIREHASSFLGSPVSPSIARYIYVQVFNAFGSNVTRYRTASSLQSLPGMETQALSQGLRLSVAP